MARKKSKSINGLEGAPYSMPPDTVFVLSSEQLNDTVRRASALKEAELASKYELTSFKEVQRWPDLFVLFSTSNGSFLAMLDGKLEEHYDALTIGVDAKSGLLIDALSALDKLNPNTLKDLLKTVRSSSSPKALAKGNLIHIMKGPESSPLDLERLIVLVSNLKESIGPELHRMHYFRDGPHEKAATKVIKTFEKAVSAWNRRSLPSHSHGNAKKLPYGKHFTGHPLERSLSWIAIEVTRELVEKNQALPNREEVIVEMKSRFPELVNKTKKRWNELFIKAGLSALKSDEPWANSKRKLQAKAADKNEKCSPEKKANFHRPTI